MKNFTLVLFLSFFVYSLNAQNGPIDFEASGFGANWTWTGFENGTNPPLEIVANPDMSGINTSSTVAKFTALDAGEPHVGCETMHGADIGSFVIDASNSTIRIMVWKSTISDVGIKLVTASSWAKPELKVANTKINEWEQLTFDFSTVDHEGMTYDQIVIFPDFTDRAADNVIYFDNVYGEVAVNSPVSDIEQEEISILPNPASDLIELSTEKNISDISVYSIAGEQVINRSFSTNNVSLDVSGLANGMYLVHAKLEDGNIIINKFVKH